MNELLVAAVLANLADLATFLRVNPTLIPGNETSPMPLVFGQTAGALAAKMVMALVIVVTVVAFRKRPRTQGVLLAIYTGIAVVGAASNVLLG